MGKASKYITSAFVAVSMLLQGGITAMAEDETDAGNTSSKIVYVDDDYTEAEEGKYSSIQEAIDYINGTEDKTGWKVSVAAGSYSAFTIRQGMNNLTIAGASSDSVTISTWSDDSNGAIVVDRAGNVTIDNVTITVGANTTKWYSAGIELSNMATTMEADNGFTLSNSVVSGVGATSYSVGGYGLFIDNLVDSFTITNTTFTNLSQATYMENTAGGPNNVTITGNTYVNCSFAFHGSWATGVSGGSFTFSDNTVTGSDSLRNKVVIQDTNNTNLTSVSVSDNTLENAIVGVINLTSGTDINDVLSSNTFGTGSFFVDAVEPGTINTYTTYQVSSTSTGYWQYTGIESLEDYDANPTGTIAVVRNAIDEANKQGLKTLSITSLDELGSDTLIKTFTWFKDAIYWVSIDQTSVTVTKSWDDADDQDGVRPDSVTVALLANDELTGETVTLSADNNWTATFSNLPVQQYVSLNDDGTANLTDITYSISEVSVDDYTTNVVNNGDGTFTLTNIHTPETIDVTVHKEWSDGNDADGVRPDSVTVNLLADGTVLESVELNADNNWSYTFEDVAKYASGSEITYTVTEDAVTGYTTTVSDAVEGDGTLTFTVTNSHTVTPTPTTTPTATPTNGTTIVVETPGPQYQSCQDAGYSSDYEWSDSANACVLKTTTSKSAVVPNTSDENNITMWIIVTVMAVATAAFSAFKLHFNR